VLVTCADAKAHISQGSGIIVRTNGVIATNYHVIAGAVSARVKLHNGDIYDDVSVLDTDERKDIAVLKIKAINLPVLTATDSDTVRVGTSVYVIGSPRGLEGTLSSGIVSGIRPAEELDSNLTGFRLIQITAPISPGSSGGPLLDEAGKLIGLVFASRVDAQSINLAVPINYVVAMASSVRNQGRNLARIRNVEKTPSDNESTDDIAGTYTGTWASDYYDVSGVLVLTVTISNGRPQVKAAFTGSAYLSEDTLDVKLLSMGARVWRMEYKGKHSKITGTGLFRSGRFVGDYRLRRHLRTDRGKWALSRVD
jgi:S1-C subfamily serine protease